MSEFELTAADMGVSGELSLTEAMGSVAAGANSERARIQALESNANRHQADRRVVIRRELAYGELQKLIPSSVRSGPRADVLGVFRGEINRGLRGAYRLLNVETWAGRFGTLPIAILVAPTASLIGASQTLEGTRKPIMRWLTSREVHDELRDKIIGSLEQRIDNRNLFQKCWFWVFRHWDPDGKMIQKVKDEFSLTAPKGRIKRFEFPTLSLGENEVEVEGPDLDSLAKRYTSVSRRFLRNLEARYGVPVGEILDDVGAEQKDTGRTRVTSKGVLYAAGAMGVGVGLTTWLVWETFRRSDISFATLLTAIAAPPTIPVVAQAVSKFRIASGKLYEGILNRSVERATDEAEALVAEADIAAKLPDYDLGQRRREELVAEVRRVAQAQVTNQPLDEVVNALKGAIEGEEFEPELLTEDNLPYELVRLGAYYIGLLSAEYREEITASGEVMELNLEGEIVRLIRRLVRVENDKALRPRVLGVLSRRIQELQNMLTTLRVAEITPAAPTERLLDLAWNEIMRIDDEFRAEYGYLQGYESEWPILERPVWERLRS